MDVTEIAKPLFFCYGHGHSGDADGGWEGAPNGLIFLFLAHIYTSALYSYVLEDYLWRFKGRNATTQGCIFFIRKGKKIYIVFRITFSFYRSINHNFCLLMYSWLRNPQVRHDIKLSF